MVPFLQSQKCYTTLDMHPNEAGITELPSLVPNCRARCRTAVLGGELPNSVPNCRAWWLLVWLVATHTLAVCDTGHGHFMMIGSWFLAKTTPVGVSLKTRTMLMTVLLGKLNLNYMTRDSNSHSELKSSRLRIHTLNKDQQLPQMRALDRAYKDQCKPTQGGKEKGSHGQHSKARNEVVDILSAMPELTLVQQIDVTEIILEKVERVEHFMRLAEGSRLTYVSRALEKYRHI
ncbi:hypothetical protein SASPL_120639 [Salvia splendens]|uniref:Uncharacterized protein n=1 Tax=Salvia splendens TaxID=180675 RepID=A0A8X8XQW3_SALSN|nr:hypothetical protein SASPL_120639 [Salvia splendens]